MRFLLLLCFVVIAHPDEIEYLGVLSPRRAIALDSTTPRPDLRHFCVELQHASQSNRLTIYVTNEVLTVDDVNVLPSGPIIMGVKSVFMDGTTSDVRIYRFDLFRGKPATPSARMIELGAPVAPEPTLERAVNARRSIAIRSPPTPGSTNASTNAVMPLPNGSPRTYADQMDAMVQFSRTYRRRLP